MPRKFNSKQHYLLSDGLFTYTGPNCKAKAIYSSELETYMTLILFCADWCSSCREFKPTFDAFSYPGLSRHWVDIENEDQLMPGIEVENLPSIFVLSNDKLSWYFGAIRPSSLFMEKILSDLEAGKFESKPIEARFVNLLKNLN